MNTKYILVKGPQTNEAVYINYSKISGYEFKPKNNIKNHGIKVNSLILIKPSFVEKILKKKIKRNLNIYLQHFINTIDDNEDDDSNLRGVLNDIERLKRKIINKYRGYLDEKYLMLLNKKLLLLENEIKGKLVEIEMHHEFSEEKEELRKSR